MSSRTPGGTRTPGLIPQVYTHQRLDDNANCRQQHKLHCYNSTSQYSTCAQFTFTLSAACSVSLGLKQ